MSDLLPLFTSYGLPGLALAGVLWLAYKLIDRGFSVEVPPRKRR